MEAFLIYMHIDPSDLFAGFSGGILAVFVTAGPRPNLWTIFCSIGSGAITGAYFGPVAPYWVPSSWGVKPGPFVSCVCGCAGMSLGRLVIAGAQRLKWRDSGVR